MAPLRRTHAPHYKYGFEPLCQRDLEGLIAAKGATVTCRACIAMLRTYPQWGNQLLKDGIRFHLAAQKAKRKEPRCKKTREMW